MQSAELIDRFKLDFANRTLGYRLPEKNRKAGAEIRGQLQEIGILKKSGHEPETLWRSQGNVDTEIDFDYDPEQQRMRKTTTVTTDAGQPG